VSYSESQSLCGARLPLTKFDGKEGEEELGSLTRALAAAARHFLQDHCAARFKHRAFGFGILDQWKQQD
jgi:hypothetical protein